MKKNQLKDTRSVILMFIGFIIVAVYFFIDGTKRSQKAYLENLNRQFSGSVKSVRYDIKEFPTVIIGDSSYYIDGTLYYTDHQIEAGDSMIKKRGSETYRLIKHGSNKIIEFKR